MNKFATILPVAALLALTACGGTAESTPTPPTSTRSNAPALAVTDPWTKAADSGMTAAFGTLTNSSDTDVHIVAASSGVATHLELHEMFTDDSGTTVMREKEDGFVVEAGASHELSPGGDHLMFMDLTRPILPGDEVVVTLTAEDGSTFEFTAPARSYSGANESYHEGDDLSGDVSGDVSGETMDMS